MPNKELSNITLGSALRGDEIFYGEQDGNSRRFTASMIAALNRELAAQTVLPVADAAAIDAQGVRTQAIAASAPIASPCVSTNLLTSLRRTNYGGNAGAAHSAGFYVDGPSLYLGDVADRGGFDVSFGLGLEVLNAAAQTRYFGGLLGETDPAGLEPSALVNMIGIGADLADNTLQLMRNNGAGAATKIDLGWPGKTAGEAWMLRLTADPNAQLITYLVTRLSDGDTVEGTFATEMPVATVFMGPCLYNNNGAGGGAGVRTPFLGYVGRARSL